MNKIIWSGFREKEGDIDSVLLCVGEGWHSLLRALVDDLFKAGWDGRLFQVKEKFGGLRFYTGEVNDACSDLISTAEDMSEKLCEICGEEGRLRTNGWWKTYCDKHDKERGQ